MLLSWLANIKNTLDFNLRKTLKFSRKNYQEPVDDLTHCFMDNAELQQLEQALLKQYPLLQQLKSSCSLQRYFENLSLLDELNQLRPATTFQETSALNVLEIGVKNWSTLPALAAFVEAHTAKHSWQITGLEVDCWRLYPNGYSRWGYLQTYLKQVQSWLTPNQQTITAIEADFLSWIPPQRFDWIVCVLPFVFEEPHRAWGLPKRLFNPQQFFKQLFENCLTKDGQVILINQGQAECLAQANLLNRPIEQAILLASRFRKHQYPRFGWWLNYHNPTDQQHPTPTHQTEVAL